MKTLLITEMLGREPSLLRAVELRNIGPSRLVAVLPPSGKRCSSGLVQLLPTSARESSRGGQQQRLCIARAISINPEVLLMDEPCSALDPIATSKIEDLMWELKENFSIIIVTHSMQQAARVSQRTGFFHLGDLVEVDTTEKIFQNPVDSRTRDYITGRFG